MQTHFKYQHIGKDCLTHTVFNLVENSGIWFSSYTLNQSFKHQVYKDLFYSEVCVYVSVCECECVHVDEGAHGGQRHQLP